ncbi:hypothetical protein [Methanospirillum lacunae]|uniref:Uncharacterized protein n=1 Tax=Methanospirillum lacunae TaxID=668570 RepID=A0A2V2N773_9EURY|nr:hypothetical protein [Methanospirillum lacunae]PWR71391.1 hypothetical protein DK846_11030 [Methanospirillum lacunae]
MIEAEGGQTGIAESMVVIPGKMNTIRVFCIKIAKDLPEFIRLSFVENPCIDNPFGAWVDLTASSKETFISESVVCRQNCRHFPDITNVSERLIF